MAIETSKQPPHPELAFIPWLVSGVAAVLAIIVWGNSFNWQFSALSVYQTFPILGLLAFSLMWGSYVTGTLRRLFLQDVDLSKYFTWTGYVVLVAVLLHPGLLAFQRFRDGFGLPPGSEIGYVASSMSWFVVLGFINLLIVLSFELHRWFERRHWWRYILFANDAAMISIFIHGLELGTQTHVGWYRVIWWFYGLSLVAILATKYARYALGLERVQDFDTLDDKPKKAPRPIIPIANPKTRQTQAKPPVI